MDWIALRNLPKGLGGALALLWLLSLLSFDLNDPTLTNLRLPAEGVANLAGLPGALLGGSLLELLGTAALLGPFLLLHWLLVQARRPPLHRYTAWSVALLTGLSGIHGLLVPIGDPGLLGSGLAGWAVQRWAALTTGPWVGGMLCGLIALAALRQVLYAPAVAQALRDAGIFGRWSLRAMGTRWHAGWDALRTRSARMSRVAGATALGVRAGAGGVGQRCLRAMLWLPLTLIALPGALLGRIAALRFPSLASVKQRARDTQQGTWSAAGASSPGNARGDGFDEWFRTDSDPADASLPTMAAGDPAPSPPGTAGAHPPAPAPAPGSPSEEWEGWYPQPLPHAATAAEADSGAVEAATGADERRGTTDGNAFAADDAPEATDPPSTMAPAVEDPPEPVPDTAALGAEPDYHFEQPAAETAWRERFRRYARNLDLDWEEQTWRQGEEDDAESDRSPEPDSA